MSKTKKRKVVKQNKTRKNNKNKFTTIRLVPDRTPKMVRNVSNAIFNDVSRHHFVPDSPNVQNSYSPSVNEELIALKSVQRTKAIDCNNERAFDLKEPLHIGIPGKLFGKTCVPYYDTKAVRFLLKNLEANKHINVDKIVPPVQSHSNCWFNTMFVILFISDKGRKFFHFFRQLMIEGVQSNKKEIPKQLRNGFALLNYAIDACLTGNKYSYTLDTNAIIKNIYENIPDAYKSKHAYITNVDEAGNPLKYYEKLIKYLNNDSIQLTFISDTNDKWKASVERELNKSKHLPHVIVLEFYDGTNKTPGNSGKVENKPRSFFVKGAKYVLDSCVIRDTSQQHFSACLTCEKHDYVYDGMSFSRLEKQEWKKYINSDYSWSFVGSLDANGFPLEWNFKHGYQMLVYYRDK